MSKTLRKVKGHKVRDNDAPRRHKDGGHLVLTPPTPKALRKGAEALDALLAVRHG